MPARTYLPVNLAIKKNENVDELILQVVGSAKLLTLMKLERLRVIFAPAVVPLITRLEEQFTKYDIEQISGLSSAYAVRLYELLICWRTTGKTPIIDLTEFRKRIGVLDTEYQRMDVFKRGVLELALKQVNEHTDITASYEQHKKGRVITGFSFKFKQKKPKQAEIATETPKTATNDPDTTKPLTEPQIAKYSMILCKLGSISDLSNFPDYPAFCKLDWEHFEEP